MTLDEIFWLSDAELAAAYRAWSGDTHCSGWETDTEQHRAAFIEWMQGPSRRPRVELTRYEEDTIARIKRDLAQIEPLP